MVSSQKSRLHDIPVVVTDADDLKSLEFAIVENVQRHDLNPLEEAQGYQRLIDEFSYDQEKSLNLLVKVEAILLMLLELLNLPKEVLEFIEEKNYFWSCKNLSWARECSIFSNKIIEKKLSVRQAENFVKIFKKQNKLSKRLKIQIYRS